MKIDQIIRTKRRTIALIINTEGKLIIRAPLRATQKQIEYVVEQKMGWIKVKQEQVRTAYAHFAPKEFVNGEEFLYMGKVYRLAIVDGPDQPLHLTDQFYLSRTSLAHAETIFKRWYIAQAKRVITERGKVYAARNHFEYRRIKITQAQTRWGSCSSSGNLNFSWRLVMAPLQVIDYVVVHELVHLHEKNHSQRFWDRVKTILPGYALQVQWLKKNGYMLRL